MLEWTTKNIPDQTGKVALITGGNSGLGFETALALARAGADVIIASRNSTKALAALAVFKQKIPQAKVDFRQLDLASLTSIRSFAIEFNAANQRLDLLFNNAGIAISQRQETEDGFEKHFGVNHLGHFALTGLLLNKLLNTPGSRIVTTTSILQAIGWINFRDLQLRNSYISLLAYGQSKLANMLFVAELDRRLKAVNAATLSLAAHPGFSNTQMTQSGSGIFGTQLEDFVIKFTTTTIAQSAAMGALPQLYAATAPQVKGGGLYGPLFYTHGYPVANISAMQTFDNQTARHLWEVSENLTSVHYDFNPPNAASHFRVNEIGKEEPIYFHSRN